MQNLIKKKLKCLGCEKHTKNTNLSHHKKKQKQKIKGENANNI